MQILQSRRFAGWRGANPHKGATEPRPYAVCVDFSFAFTPDLIAVFVTLFVLEIVLGVDNVMQKQDRRMQKQAAAQCQL